MPSITKQLREFLAPLLPGTWDVHSVEKNLGTLARPAVLMTYMSSAVQFAGPMPLGDRYEIQVTYVSNERSSFDAADDDLWDAQGLITDALRRLPFVELTGTQRGTYGDDGEGNATYWAHIFTLQIGIPYTPNPEPDAEPDTTPEEE